jgi:hypothetical protein
MRNFIVTQAASVILVSTAYFALWCGNGVAQEGYTGQLGTYIAPSRMVSAPVVDRAAQRSERFRKLVSQWNMERGVSSSITEGALCLSYQEIIGMGPDAISLILAQLKSEGDEPDQWFWALRVITGADPVDPQDSGDYLKMARAWFEWAAREGYAA